MNKALSAPETGQEFTTLLEGLTELGNEQWIMESLQSIPGSKEEALSFLRELGTPTLTLLSREQYMALFNGFRSAHRVGLLTGETWRKLTPEQIKRLARGNDREVVTWAAEYLRKTPECVIKAVQGEVADVCE